MGNCPFRELIHFPVWPGGRLCHRYLLVVLVVWLIPRTISGSSAKQKQKQKHFGYCWPSCLPPSIVAYIMHCIYTRISPHSLAITTQEWAILSRIGVELKSRLNDTRNWNEITCKMCFNFQWTRQPAALLLLLWALCFVTEGGWCGRQVGPNSSIYFPISEIDHSPLQQRLLTRHTNISLNDVIGCLLYSVLCSVFLHFPWLK